MQKFDEILENEKTSKGLKNVQATDETEVNTEQIKAADIINMNRVAAENKTIEIDIAYADAGHPQNHFGQLYNKDAELYMHSDLAEIAIRAAEIVNKNHGWKLTLMDGLRTTNAQQGMFPVKEENGCPDDYVSSPGQGAHPRGMAIDIVPVDAHGEKINMGSEFDDFETTSNRDYAHSEEVLNNRKILDDAMLQAAKEFGKELYLMPTEWWDFRFTPDVYEQYEPVSDKDLESMGIARQTQTTVEMTR